MASALSIPRRLPLLTIVDHVLLPGSSMRIPVRSMKNMNMIKSQLLSKNTLRSTVIGVLPSSAAHESDDVYHPIGTAAVVVQVTETNWPRPAYTLLVTGLCRFRLEKVIQETPFPIAMVAQLDHIPSSDSELQNSEELQNLVQNFREHAMKLVEMLDVSIPVVAKLKTMLDSLPSEHLPDVCTAVVKATYGEKIQILDAVNLRQRFEKTLPLLMRQIEGLKLLQKARKENVEIVDRRDGFNEKSAVRVTSELDDDMDDDDMHDLENRIRAAKIPGTMMKNVIKEMRRLKKMSPQQPDHAMLRNYLDLVADLPWSMSTKDTIDVRQARLDLDTDHYGLDTLKKRVIEYLAVRQLRNNLKGPILCFVGPPGVGKTSVGRSIAHTLGRQFYRISLGGMCDQSDIRGHRRTYIGSMPGRIILGLKHVATNNPVFLLDEVDKLGKSMQGDPASALLEVLDPEQNVAFTDHYLNLPFDLSQVLFIATANNLATIPPPLLDRMETIHIPGYTQEEKIVIASRHLLPKQLEMHGLDVTKLDIPEDSLMIIVSRYTQEAGVRSLERQIGAICRAVAVKIAEAPQSSQTLDTPAHDSPCAPASSNVTDDTNKTEGMIFPFDHPPSLPIVINESALEDILGPPQYYQDMAERLSQPGVAIGLAWTTMGGTIMYVEATKMAGQGQVTLTGHLGAVMKESANLALNWLRSHSQELELGEASQLTKDIDVHIHFPEGAVGKDGPSAGVTIVTVLVSLFSGRCVRSDTAMTGEITLRGLVLPVGGIKEKVLAAHRAGLARVILPRRNLKDLHEVPDHVKANMEFVFVSKLHEVLSASFPDVFEAQNEAPQPVSSKL